MTDQNEPPAGAVADVRSLPQSPTAIPAWEDPSYYASIRGAESGGNDAAVNKLSGATGRYQFMPKTWAGLMRRYPTLGLTVAGRTDGDQQERAVKAFTHDNAKALDRNGLQVTKGTLYAAHFLGSGGAIEPLKAPAETPMRDLVSTAVIAQNPHLRDMTAGDFRAWADRKGGSSAGSRNNEAVSFGDVEPSRPVTNNERLDVEAAKKDQGQGLFGTAGDAVRAEWSLLWGLQGNSGLAPDPDFAPTADQLMEKAKLYGIPTTKLEWLSQAHSEEHLDYLGRQYQDDAEREQRIADAGGLGTALRVGAALLDPAAIAAGIGLTAASGGLGMPAAIAARFGRAGTIVADGLTAAAANVSTDAIIAANKPITDDNMLLWSAGAGLVLGGALGTLRRNPHVQAEADALENVGRSMQDQAVGLPVNLPGSAGAARNSPREALRLETDEVRQMAEAYETGGVFAPGVRFDIAAALKGSENPLTRVLGDNLVADTVGAKNKARATPIAAEEVQRQLQTRADTIWQRDLQSAYRDFGTRRGFNWLDWDRQREAFNSEVTRFVRNTDPLEEFDPAVSKAGAAFRKLTSSWAEHLHNPGLLDGGNYRPVKGAETLEANATYAPRIPDVRAVDERLTRFGNPQLEELVAHAIRSNRAEIDEAVTKRVARAYVRKLQSISYGEELTRGRTLGGDDLDAFKREMLEGTDLDEADIDALAGGLERPAQDGAKPRLKHRLQLDENAGLNLHDIRTGEVVFTRFSDLLSNDADHLMQGYSRWASGQVALARVKVKNPNHVPGETPEYLIDGITSAAEFDKLKAQVSAIGEQSGVDRTRNSVDLTRLQFVHDAITGVPHPMEGTSFGHALRMLRDYNFSRVMNQAVFAQIPELVSIAGQLGVKAMWNGMPPLRTLVRDMKTGSLGEDLAEELELITGAGTDWLRGASHARWDDFGNPMTLTGSNPYLVGADNLLRKGKRITSAVSGMAPVNTLLQRWVSRAMAQKFAGIALGEAPNMNRLRSLGLDDDMVGRISGQLRAKAGIEGGKLKRLNVEQWDDLEAASAFRNAMFRGSRRIIQENDVGNMAMWMSHPLAKTLLQFRTFVIGSWSKTLLHNVHMRDFETYATFMASLFAGSLTYIAQTHLNAATSPDREKQLDKKLTVNAIARAGLQRSSWFSLFGPGLDTAALALGADPVFDARTTALSSDIVFGNPTVDLIASATKATGSIAQGVVSGDGTQAGVRNVTRALPFQNFLPFVALTNVLTRDLKKWDD